MPKQTAKHCLYYVGDGGGKPSTATTYALQRAGSATLLTDSANGLGAVKPWSTVTVSGFADTPAFVAVVTTATAGTLTLDAPVSPDSRRDVTITPEPEGKKVTIVVETYAELLGQDNTSYNKSASDIDVSDKNSGNWGAAIAGAVSMTVTVGGKIEFTSDGTHGGWTRLSDALDNGDTVNGRLRLNEGGDSYYAPFAGTSQEGGGGVSDANKYSYSLKPAARPVLVLAR